MIGLTISHYKILEKLGEGGMGVVYKAEDTKLRRSVALKFFPPEMTRDESAKKRFVIEAQAASALDHPNIAIVHDINETEDGRSFICMAYYDGETLKQKIEAGPLNLEEALSIALQTAEGLQRAHEAGIVHRDIKPANLILTKRGQVKIVDFGLVKLTGATKITKAGMAVGTIAYMSPEQIRGDHVDHRADIWSLGIVLYEMLTARMPFPGEYEQAVAYRILNQEPERVDRPVPHQADAIISRALRKNPSDRYDNMDALIIALKDALRSLGGGTPSTGMRVTEKAMALPRASWIRVAQEKRVFQNVFSHGGISVLRLIMISATAILVVAAVALFGILTQKEGSTRSPGVPAPLEGERISIAVTSFENNTGDPELGWLSRGIADLLMNDLSQSKYLQVVSKERSMSIEAARRSRAKIITSGSFIQAGSMLRILAQITDASSDQLIRTEYVEGEGSDQVFTMADALAAKIKFALEIKASGTEGMAERITKVKTTSVEAYKYYITGRDRLEKEYYEEAILNLRKAIQIDSTFLLAYDALANVYDVLGEQSFAGEVITKAIRLSKEMPLVDRLPILLRDAQVRGDWDAELEYLQRLILLQPDEPNWHFKLGWHYAIHKRLYEQSVLEYTKAIEMEPLGQPRFYYYLGFAYVSWGKRDKAIDAFEKYVSLSPEDAHTHDVLGSVYLLTGDYEKAEQELKGALQQKPDLASAMANFANLFLARGMNAEALTYYEAFLSHAVGANQRKEGYCYLARYFLENQMLDKSMQEITRALALDPVMLEALWLRGRVNVAKGKLDSAQRVLEEMERIVKRSRSHYQEEVVHHLRGIIEMKKGNFTRAIGEFQTALILGPTDQPFFRTALAEAYQRNGDTEKAVDAYLKVFDFNSKYARAHFMLGRLYEEQGKRSKALEQYSLFLSIWKDADKENPLLDLVNENASKLKMAI